LAAETSSSVLKYEFERKQGKLNTGTEKYSQSDRSNISNGILTVKSFRPMEEIRTAMSPSKRHMEQVR